MIIPNSRMKDFRIKPFFYAAPTLLKWVDKPEKPL